MKPILFSTQMVQAILDGKKTMTRRVVKFPHSFSHADFNIYGYEGIVNGKHLFTWGRNINGAYFDGAIGVNQPYSVGQVMWVRETWRSTDFEYHDGKWVASIQYKDLNKGARVSWWDNTDVGEPDDCIYSKTGWHPSIHMPREAARLFLRVTSVRAERVQDISEDDAKREGVCGLCYDAKTGEERYSMTYFKVLWDSLNAKRGYGWDSNPFVWVISFERLE